MDRDILASQRVPCQPAVSQSFTPEERLRHSGSVPSRTDICAERALMAVNQPKPRPECTLGAKS
jgi:hypothetical protein